MINPPLFDKLLTEQRVATVVVSANSHRHLQNVLHHSDSNFNITMTIYIKTCKSVGPKEDLLIDLDVGIKETKITVETLNQIKQTIMDNSNIILHTFCSSFS